MKNSIYFFFILALCISEKYSYSQNTIYADSLFNTQQWEVAAKKYEAFSLSNPKDKPGFYLNRIGQCYFNLKDYEKAIEAYKKAIGINGNLTVMYNLACAYSMFSQNDSALAWLNRSADAGLALYEETIKDEDLKGLQADPKFKIITDKIKKNLLPCAFLSEAHQFDFWIGNWNVFNLKGQQSGKSRIEQILGQCLIFENWTDKNGGQGKSFNVYNPSTKFWQQTWVDDKGGMTEFIEGVYKDGTMRFANSRPELVNGKKVYRRLTFFNTNTDEVRQLGEMSDRKSVV